MCKKPCKECSWVVRNNHNDSIINHSKKWGKTHNCHMVEPSKRDGLWDTKEEYQCKGNREYFKTLSGTISP